MEDFYDWEVSSEEYYYEMACEALMAEEYEEWLKTQPEPWEV